MNINCRKFRFNSYKDHELTGNKPVIEFKYGGYSYVSADDGWLHINYWIKVWLTTFHFKWRYYS